MPADLASGESQLPGLQMVVFLLYPHLVESRETESKLCPISLSKGTNPIHEGGTSQTTITLGVKISTNEMGSGKGAQAFSP